MSSSGPGPNRWNPISLRRDEVGATLIEAALLFPLVFLLFFGIIQWGLILTTYVSLYNSADVAGRYSVLQPTPSDSQIRSMAIASLGPMMSSGNLVSPIAIDHNVTVGGVSGATRVTMVYNMPIMFRYGVPGSNSGTYSLTAVVVYR